MSGTSKWPISELKIAFSLAPKGLARALDTPRAVCRSAQNAIPGLAGFRSRRGMPVLASADFLDTRTGLSARDAAVAKLGGWKPRPGPMSAPAAVGKPRSRRNHHAPLQAAADRLVLGGLSDGHPLQWHLGSAT